MTRSQSRKWNDLTALATEELDSRFPDLMTGPTLPNATASTSLTQLDHKNLPQAYTPWRLYRGIVPPINDPDSSIAFSGFRTSITNTIRVELTTLWIQAYMTHSPALVLPGAEERQYAAALEARWADARTPCGQGRDCPDDGFDQLTSWDELVGDLGVEVWRLGKKWWDVSGVWRGLSKLFGSYGGGEYREVVSEWIEKDGRMRRGEKVLYD